MYLGNGLLHESHEWSLHQFLTWHHGILRVGTYLPPYEAWLTKPISPTPLENTTFTAWRLLRCSSRLIQPTDIVNALFMNRWHFRHRKCALAVSFHGFLEIRIADLCSSHIVRFGLHLSTYIGCVNIKKLHLVT